MRGDDPRIGSRLDAAVGGLDPWFSDPTGVPSMTLLPRIAEYAPFPPVGDFARLRELRGPEIDIPARFVGLG